MERYLVRDGKKLKYGYTTGTCATGAALAAAMLLKEGEAPEAVVVHTPKGWAVTLAVEEPRAGDGWASAAVRKDAGDDPDVTDQLQICARVQWNDAGSVILRGGEGVGTVTRPGLQIPVGEPAINPVPRRMLAETLQPFVNGTQGITVTISVPQGEETARKTFNSRLGILGGISIIGTSGIVEPMSEEALKESLAVELSVRRAEGLDRIVMTPGNYGRELGETLGIPEGSVVKTSNFIGFMLDRAAAAGFSEVLLVGHAGKLVKVAAGVFQTHSSVADARLETLAAWAGAKGADTAMIRSILESNTTEEAVGILKQGGMLSVMDVIAAQASLRATQRVRDSLKVGTILFTLEEGVVGMDDAAKRMLEELTHESR